MSSLHQTNISFSRLCISFPKAVDQAAEYGHFSLKLLLTQQVPLFKTTKSPVKHCCKKKIAPLELPSRWQASLILFFFVCSSSFFEILQWFSIQTLLVYASAILYLKWIKFSNRCHWMQNRRHSTNKYWWILSLSDLGFFSPKWRNQTRKNHA